MTCDELQATLAAYVDSELSGGEMAAVETHLRGCASCATEARSLLQMKVATRAAGQRYTPSVDFRRMMERKLTAESRTRWWSLRLPKFAMAAVVALLIAGSVALYVDRAGREHELSEIADLHVTDLASANPVDVTSTDKHTVKPWFAGKIPFSFNLPELQNSEFTLIGGRVAYFERSSGAQLLFGLRKHQLSVFIFKEEDAAFHGTTFTATRLALHVESWSEGGLRYFVVSDAPANDVHTLSELLKKADRS